MKSVAHSLEYLHSINDYSSADIGNNHTKKQKKLATASELVKKCDLLFQPSDNTMNLKI